MQAFSKRAKPSQVAVVLITLLLGLSQTAVAAQNTDSRSTGNHEADQQAIRALITAQREAWNRGDIDAFVQAYWHSPELTFSGSGGVSRGFDGVVARYKKNYPDRATMGTLDFSNLEFHFLGPDAAFVLGRWHLKREKDELGGVFTLVWQRFPEGWRIVHDHTSADAPAK